MDNKALFKAFRLAIENELEAIDFYKSLSENNEDAELKELFKSFVRDKTRHLSQLMGRYRMLKSKTNPLNNNLRG